MTRIPEPLKAGDLVAILAPSWSMNVVGEDILKNIENYFWSFGVNVVYWKACRKDFFWSGWTPKERADDMMEAFKNPRIKAIIPIFWWFTANQVLPYLDFDYIQAHPKFLMWYSDITALDIAILSKTWITTLLWPGWTQLWHYFPDKYTLGSFEDMMMLGKKEISIWASKIWTQWARRLDSNHDTREKINNDWWLVVNAWEAFWISFWWNISTLALLLGSEYIKIPKNSILFLEECWDLTEGRIIRYLEQFNQVWLFTTAKAVIFGRFEKSSKLRFDYLSEVMKNYIGDDIPLVLNTDFWHTEPMMTIPLWIKTTINTHEQKISFSMTDSEWE